MIVTCAVCQSEFSAKRSTAKYCSERCRQRNRRTSGSSADGMPEPSELVTAIRKELEKLRRIDTVDGQLAIELAIKITTPGMTGVAGLSKELRDLRAHITMAAAPPAPTGPKSKDEVGEARRKRDSKKTRQAVRRA